MIIASAPYAAIDNSIDRKVLQMDNKPQKQFPESPNECFVPSCTTKVIMDAVNPYHK
jgi:hypothetical protein